MFRNGIYNMAGAAIRTALTLLTIPLLIRLIGVNEYGLWTLVSAVIGLIGLAEAGLSVSTTVFVARDLANDDTAGLAQTLTVCVAGMLALATAAALLLWVGAASVVHLFPTLSVAQQQTALQSWQIGGIIVWARLLQQVLVGLEQAYQRYGAMNALNTMQALFANVGMLVVAWLGGRVLALMAWQAAVSIVWLIAHTGLGWWLVRHLHLRPQWSAVRSRALLRYSALTWLSSLGSALFSQADRLIVGAVLGTSTLGVYAAITNVVVQINTFSALPVQPLLPKLASIIAKPTLNTRALRQSVARAFGANIAVALSMGLGLLVLAPLAVWVLLPNTTPEYVNAFRLAVLIYTLYSLNAVGYYILFAIERLHVGLAINLTSGVLSLTLIALLAQRFNLVGAIAGNAGYLLSLLFVVFAIKYLHAALLDTQVRPHAVPH